MGCHTRSRREHAGRRELPRLRREAAGRLGLRVLRVVRVGVSKRVAVCTDCGGAASQPANQRDGGWPRAGHRTGCRAALPPPLGAVRYCSSLSGRPRWFRDPHPQQRASRVARNAPGAPRVAAIGAISDCLVTFHASIRSSQNSRSCPPKFRRQSELRVGRSLSDFHPKILSHSGLRLRTTFAT